MPTQINIYHRLPFDDDTKEGKDGRVAKYFLIPPNDSYTIRNDGNLEIHCNGEKITTSLPFKIIES